MDLDNILQKKNDLRHPAEYDTQSLNTCVEMLHTTCYTLLFNTDFQVYEQMGLEFRIYRSLLFVARKGF